MNSIQQVREAYGEWTAHNLEYKPGMFTIGAGASNRWLLRAQVYAEYLDQFLRVRLRKPRVLDLGCLEGGVSIILAKKGYKCTGIDIRDAHLEKAAFVSENLNLKKTQCRWIKGDVNDESLWDSLDKFDVIICSGLLYHIHSDAIMPLLKQCLNHLKHNGILIVDSNISDIPSEEYKVDKDLSLFGRTWKEHETDTPTEDRISAVWSSLHNDSAFWLTERSLTNALVHAGFGHINKSLFPFHEWGHKCRDIWFAHHSRKKSQRIHFRTEPDDRPVMHPGFL